MAGPVLEALGLGQGAQQPEAPSGLDEQALREGINRRIRKGLPEKPVEDAYTSAVEDAKGIIALRELQRRFQDPLIQAYRSKYPNLGGLETYALPAVLDVQSRQASERISPEVQAANALKAAIINTRFQYQKSVQGARSISDADIKAAGQIVPTLEKLGTSDAQFEALIAPLKNDLMLSSELLADDQWANVERMLFGQDRQAVLQGIFGVPQGAQPKPQAPQPAPQAQPGPIAPPQATPTAPSPAQGQSTYNFLKQLQTGGR